MKKDIPFKLFTDGGSRGNPGPAGIGVVLQDPRGTIIGSYKSYIGEATNNQAEYQALLLGLKKAREQKVVYLDCCLDSELVVKQLRREYRIKDPVLGKFFLQAWNEIQKFRRVRFFHIPRRENSLADRLVNEALDSVLKKPRY